MKTYKTSITRYILPVVFIMCVLAQQKSSAQPTVIENGIKFTSQQNATLVGADGLIMKTKDGGLTWNTASVPTTNELLGEDFIDEFTGMVVGINGTVIITLDAGNLWELKSSGTTDNLNSIKAVRSSVWVACGDNGTIIRTIDGGQSWTQVNSFTTSSLNDVEFVDNQNGFIVGDNAVLLKTYDGGANWERINISSGNPKFNLPLNAIDMKDTQNGTLVGNGGLILNTVDGGISWSAPLSTPPTENIYDVKYLSDTVAIAAGADGLMLKTIDGGFSWERIDIPQVPPTVDLKCVNFANGSTGISVGEEGTEIYTIDGGNSWSTTPPSPGLCPVSTNGTAPQIKNYPNPFNPVTNITYYLPFNAKVSIKVYNITGREIVTLADGFQSSGSYSVMFNASNLSSGVYFYRLTAIDGTSEYTMTRKMILNK